MAARGGLEDEAKFVIYFWELISNDPYMAPKIKQFSAPAVSILYYTAQKKERGQF